MIREAISQMIQDVIDGNESACKAHANLKQIETLVKAGLSAIQSGVVDEARTFNKGDNYYGGTWQLKSTASILDFAKDQEYVQLDAAAKARRKDLSAAWKAQNEGNGFFIKNDEQIPILPVKTPGKEIAVWMPEKPKAKENTGEDHKFNFDKS